MSTLGCVFASYETCSINKLLLLLDLSLFFLESCYFSQQGELSSNLVVVCDRKKQDVLFKLLALVQIFKSRFLGRKGLGITPIT